MLTRVAFNPRELTAAASLNHVILGDQIPEVRGWLAQDACSRDALLALAASHGLTSVRQSHLADDLAAATEFSDATTVDSAVATLRAFGKRLGSLTATLRHPATAPQQADSAARRGFLEHWLTIDSIWLAGGLLAGRCGAHILDGLKGVASRMAYPCHIGVLQKPERAPLAGAARSGAPATACEAVVVADLGHTSIKTAVAQPTLWPIGTHPTPASPSADELEDVVAAAILPAIEAANCGGPVRVVVSVASFVQDGPPVNDGQGIYGCLVPPTPSHLRRIEAATGLSVDLRYMHDGTGAASAAPAANSATITVGTWLGVGFRTPESPQPLNIRQRRGLTP